MEELKLILETVAKLGMGAKWLFILYLVKELIIYILGFTCLGGLIAGSYKIAKHSIPALQFERRISQIMGHGDWVSSKERENIIHIIKEYRSKS